MVAWVAGRLALAGTISIGELVAAVGLAQFLIEPLERLTRLGPLIAGARGAAGRVADLPRRGRRPSRPATACSRSRSTGTCRSSTGASPSTLTPGSTSAW